MNLCEYASNTLKSCGKPEPVICWSQNISSNLRKEY